VETQTIYYYQIKRIIVKSYEQASGCLTALTPPACPEFTRNFFFPTVMFSSYTPPELRVQGFSINAQHGKANPGKSGCGAQGLFVQVFFRRFPPCG
jgi:hypothetical protein